MKDYELRGHLVEPIGIVKIRERALHARNILQLSNGPIDMSAFLESLVKFGITYDVILDSELPDFLLYSEACCIPEKAIIYLTEDTYEKARRNEPRTRYTIFHELGHLVLMHNRDFHRRQAVHKIKPAAFNDSEWQADQFAAEILMPLHIILRDNIKSAKAIQAGFGVSAQAAQIRLNQLKRRSEI